jgi:hypothetical protein
MQTLNQKSVHEFRQETEKFSIFITACLASMKARASKQEDVCDRKQRLLRDELLLKQKLINYEK